jgi:hypothetical protein
MALNPRYEQSIAQLYADSLHIGVTRESKIHAGLSQNVPQLSGISVALPPHGYNGSPAPWPFGSELVVFWGTVIVPVVPNRR